MATNQNQPHSVPTDDPEFQELVDYFVGELPARVTELEQVTNRGDVAMLQVLVHRLKGCAPSFGFPAVGNAAANIEQAILETGADQCEIDALRSDVNELIVLCRSYFRND
ncbi:MAG: Hpt domain-containing protein [Phycisphaerales bacterium]